MERIAVSDKVYEQQEYMYKNNVHTVQDRIVSIAMVIIPSVYLQIRFTEIGKTFRIVSLEG